MKWLWALMALLAGGFAIPAEAAGPKPPEYLVFVFTSWCSPCHAMRPYVLEAKRKHRVVVYGVNAEEHSDWCKRHGIRSYPTLLRVKNNRVIAKRVGFARTADIVTFARE